jgi:hypothetical protein
MNVFVSLLLFLSMFTMSGHSIADTGTVELYGVTLQSNGEKVTVKTMVKHRWRKSLNGRYAYESAIVISPASDLAHAILSDQADLPDSGAALYEAFYSAAIVTGRMQVHHVDCDPVLCDLIPKVVTDFMVTGQFINPRNHRELLSNVKAFVQLGPELMKVLKKVDLKQFSKLTGVRVIQNEFGFYMISDEEVRIQASQTLLLTLLQAQMAKQCEAPFSATKSEKK